MEMTRVAMWNRNVLPPSETFIANQLAALGQSKVSLCGLRRAEQSLAVGRDFVLEDHFRHPRIDYKRFRLVRRHRALDKYIMRHRFDIVHAQFGYSATDILPTVVRLGIPLVTTFHGADATSRATLLQPGQLLDRRRLPAVFAYSSVLVAVSEYIAAKLIEIGAPPGKVEVVYTGIPLDKDASHCGPRDGILFVGRLVKKKGVDDLIRAVAKLDRASRETRVRIVGDGPERLFLESLSRRLGVRAEFLGFKSEAAVRQLMLTSQVFCGPSKEAPNGDSEGLGMVFLEAAHCELPVVATQHGGIPEAVIDGVSGWLVGQGDVSSMSSAIARLLSDPESRRRMGAAGAKRVREKFDVSAQAELLQAIYDDVARARRSRRCNQ